MHMREMQKSGPALWPYSRAVTAWVGAVVAYVILGWCLARWLGAGEQFSPLIYSRPVFTVTFLIFTLFLGWRALRMMVVERPARLTRALIADLRSALFNREKFIAAVPVFFGFVLFMGAFTSLKSMIPLVQDYQWDEAFAAIDRTLHFGVDPWRILQPVFGYGAITAGINVLYNLWFAVMFVVLYWQLFNTTRPDVRMRFFWSFFLVMVVCGNILAMIMASAGPCFYDVIVDAPNPFAEQMAYLQGASDAGWPIWALQTQEMLWTAYQGNATGVGSGISAMPSVHVAMATLFFLLSRSYGRWVQWAFGLFAVVTMIGSVHLAWHYAIDGYVGAIVAVAIWWVCGKFLVGETHAKLGA